MQSIVITPSLTFVAADRRCRMRMVALALFSGLWNGKWRVFWTWVEIDAKWEYSTCQYQQESRAWSPPPSFRLPQGEKDRELSVTDWCPLPVQWLLYDHADSLTASLILSCIQSFLLSLISGPPVMSERLPEHHTFWAALQRPLLAMTSISSPL